MFYQEWAKTDLESDFEYPGAWRWQPPIAALQSILTHCLVGLGHVVKAGREKGIDTCRVQVFTIKALVATHGDFAADPHRLVELIQQAVVLRDQLKERIKAKDPQKLFPTGPMAFEPATTFEALLGQAGQIRSETLDAMNGEAPGLRRLLLAGIRSLATYIDHAHLLGIQDNDLSACLMDTLTAAYSRDTGMEDLYTRLLECGRAAAKAMALLDTAQIQTYGTPVPAQVSLGIQKGHAIVISGRDFCGLEALLRQTENSGIQVYSHGEMLDAHQYPGLKQYVHFQGHYDVPESAGRPSILSFPGPVVLTAGSQIPFETDSQQRLFTSGSMSRPGIHYIPHENFKPVMDRAMAMAGFPRRENRGRVTVGNGQKGIADAADKIAQWNRKQSTGRILFMAGRDVLGVLENTKGPAMVAKGHAAIELGHCHDPHIIVRIIDALCASHDTTVADLPLSLHLSWPGQKAAGVLLSLLARGLRDIRLGPTLPAGIFARQCEVLGHRFGIRFEPAFKESAASK